VEYSLDGPINGCYIERTQTRCEGVVKASSSGGDKKSWLNQRSSRIGVSRRHKLKENTMTGSMQPVLALYGIGNWELIIILVIALLIFGKRLPELARSVGKSLTEFKKGINEAKESTDDVVDDVKKIKGDVVDDAKRAAGLNDSNTKN
jgi:sec-independent protein translocase protein TatA